MRILLTGAAGYIGGLVIANLGNCYDWVLTDCKRPANIRGLPFIQADITDIAQLRSLCEGVDMVLHLAAVGLPNSLWQDLLPNNIVGTHNVFQAAFEAGCKRIIFASSAQVILGYSPNIQVHADMPVSPLTLYGATKAWGEALAAFYAQQKNLQVICLRLGWVLARDNPNFVPSNRYLDIVITHEDLIRLIVASIQAPDDLQFGIFHGISNNRKSRLDMRNTWEQLKYTPEDDAFAIAKRNYLGIVRWWSGRVKRKLLQLENLIPR